MSATPNPALTAFVAEMGEEIVVAQVLIRRKSHQFELRHAGDRAVADEKLSQITLSDLRGISTFTARGAFRPLKSAPNLRTGWRLELRDASELDIALNQLYPGALADWFAAKDPEPPLTRFRDFTQRQTGMYRITDKLADDQAGRVIRTSCHAQFCLKRRLWTAPGVAVDSASEKSLVPCLEPCAMLLELARKAMRIEQEQKIHIELAPGEIETIVNELERSLRTLGEHPGREADLDDPQNPRRVQLVLDKLREHIARARSAKPN